MFLPVCGLLWDYQQPSCTHMLNQPKVTFHPFLLAVCSVTWWLKLIICRKIQIFILYAAAGDGVLGIHCRAALQLWNLWYLPPLHNRGNTFMNPLTEEMCIYTDHGHPHPHSNAVHYLKVPAQLPYSDGKCPHWEPRCEDNMWSLIRALLRAWAR